MFRLNLVKGLGPVLQIAEGWSVDLPAEGAQRRWTSAPIRPGRRPGSCPTSPARAPFRDVYSVMNNWGANHGAISYGHIGADLITLASMLRIPVYMHNVPEEKIFRPSAWGLFGAASRKRPTTAPAPTSARCTAEPPRGAFHVEGWLAIPEAGLLTRSEWPRLQNCEGEAGAASSTCRGLALTAALAIVLASWRPKDAGSWRETLPSATPGWPGGAMRALECSSTGACMPFRPACTRSDDHAEWILKRLTCPSPNTRTSPAVQPGEIRRRTMGDRGEGRRGEVHRHHLEAPRRLRPLPSQLTDSCVSPRPTAATCSRSWPPPAASRGSTSARTTRSWTGTIPTGACAGPERPGDRHADMNRFTEYLKGQVTEIVRTTIRPSCGSTASGRSPGPRPLQGHVCLPSRVSIPTSSSTTASG